MSKWIAPGQWDAIGRRVAKGVSFAVGIALIYWGVENVRALLAAIAAGLEPTAWSVGLALAPFGVGCAATFPNLVVPFAYRLVDMVRKNGGSSS